jgi:Fe-Mn family superoxide dismutase
VEYRLPALPYSFSALEPYIDTLTMEIHHDKHHEAYVHNLNVALEKHPDVAKIPLEELLCDLSLVPQDIKDAVRNNGGGHYNHSMFWKLMSPQGGGEPVGHVGKEIIKQFDDFDKFKSIFSLHAKQRFGSGWAWLSVDKKGGLIITSTANQDTPLIDGLVPVLGLDVWEHAYYLHYQNRRPDYIQAWWNVVNWEEVEKNYCAIVGR